MSVGELEKALQVRSVLTVREQKQARALHAKEKVTCDLSSPF